MRWSRKTQLLLAAIPVLLLLLAFVVFPGNGSRTVTVHFDKAVGVYPGTHLRVMGVRVGEVTAVVPEGTSVRVEMTYDSEYKLPADAKAAVVTPTLVADRYVQVFPAYAKGPVMKDHGDIPIQRTQTPIELDRMFKSLDDLAVTLGPKAGSTSGALDNLLTAGAKALDGNGAAGSEMIRNLSQAAEVFSDNRGPLFDNVRSLAEVTDTLAANDATVQSFLTELAGVSGQFAGERDELKQVLQSQRTVRRSAPTSSCWAVCSRGSTTRRTLSAWWFKRVRWPWATSLWPSTRAPARSGPVCRLHPDSIVLTSSCVRSWSATESRKVCATRSPPFWARCSLPHLVAPPPCRESPTCRLPRTCSWARPSRRADCRTCSPCWARR